ncbi:MAG: GTPase [Methanotrichaceae archaeon]|nr:GTPase [Methanotrichaceae archaeon]
MDRCILAYSDLSNQAVMDLANRILSAGVDFELIGMRTMLKSAKPILAVCAVRTGAGKSPTARYIVNQLKSLGLRAVVIRHPMPYGNLVEEIVQRFSCRSDLDSAHLTIEEREEYEAHIQSGTVVFAGVDYEAVLKEAEVEADVIVWDGGNNDLPFFNPDLWITVADALRPGHEVNYYPGAINFRSADVIIINKVNSASEVAIKSIEANAAKLNPEAVVIRAASRIKVEKPDLIKGKRVLVIEDGPTLTHGGMPYGAGKAAAETHGAAQIIDPKEFALGSIKETFAKYDHIGPVLPALGYNSEQIKELEETINSVDYDSKIIATPVDLIKIMTINKPSTFITYEFEDFGEPKLGGKIAEFVSELKLSGIL